MKTKFFINNILAISMLLMLLSACETLKSTYETAKKMYEATQVSKVFELTGKNCNNNTFDDGKIKIDFTIEKKQLNFVLTNLTSKPIKVNWDECSLVIDNESKRVIHSGIKFIDRNNPQSLSIVQSQSKLTDFALPSDNLYIEQQTNDLSKPNSDSNKFSIEWKINDMISSNSDEFKFYLVLKNNNKDIPYTFIFKNIIKSNK